MRNETNGAQYDQWEKVDSLKDRITHPAEFLQWEMHKKLVERFAPMASLEMKEKELLELGALGADRAQRRRDAASKCREYQMDHGKSDEFHLENSYMDFDGNIICCSPVLVLDSDSDEEDEEDLQFKDLPMNSKDLVDDLDSDSDLEIIEISSRAGPSNSPIKVPAQNPRNSNSKHRRELSDVIEPIPEGMSEKKAGKRKAVQVEVDDCAGTPSTSSRKKVRASRSNSTDSSSNRQLPRPPKPRSKQDEPPKISQAKAISERIVYWVDRLREEKEKEVKPKKPPRQDLPILVLLDFECFDEEGNLINLLTLDSIKDDNDWQIKDFKITGKICEEDEDGDRRPTTIAIGPYDFIDFQLRLHLAFDDCDNFTIHLQVKDQTYMIGSYSKRYSKLFSAEIRSSNVDSYRTKTDFIFPLLLKFLNKDMWYHFTAGGSIDLKLIQAEVDKEADFVRHEFDLEKHVYFSKPLGESVGQFTGSDIESKRKISVYTEAELWKAEDESATIRLQVGDCVSFATDSDPLHSLWFGRIVYFFTPYDDAPLQAHLSYFVSPTGTWIGEAAAGLRMLFFANDCEDVPVNSFVRKIEVHRLPLSTNVAPDTGFYYSYAALEGTRGIVDVEPYEDTNRLWLACDELCLYQCTCCESKKLTKIQASPILIKDVLQLKGIHYYINDTIQLLRSSPPAEGVKPREVGTVRLGRIIEFTTNHRVKVELIIRCDDIFDNEFKDSRRCMTTNIEEFFNLDQIDGKFILAHADSFSPNLKLNDPNSRWPAPLHTVKEKLSKDSLWFWTNYSLVDSNLFIINKRGIATDNYGKKIDNKRFPVPFDEDKIKFITSEDLAPQSNTSQVEEKVRMKEDEKIRGLASKEKILNSYSSYSGGAMFDIGLHEGAPSISTKWANDILLHQVETTRLNTGAEVHLAKTADLNYDIYSNKSYREGVKLPEQEETSFISAGPPCQSFSRANLFRFNEDPRCLEPFHLFSSIANLRPIFATMENVRDIVSFTLPTLQEDVKLINVLALMALGLGYQFIDCILSAEAFGNPSKRNRYFSLMALRGQKAPEVPEPTHSVSESSSEYCLEAKYSSTTSNRRSKNSDRHKLDQLHHSVKIGDTLDDLKNFEIARPLRGPKDKVDPLRAKFNPQVWISGNSFGFRDEVEYASIPKNSIQRSLRVNNRSEKVFNHETKGIQDGELAFAFSELGIKGKLVNGRVQEGNYLDVQPKYRPSLPPQIKEKSKKDFYARLNRNDIATPIRTSLVADGYFHGPRIHPILNRPVSTLEVARFMTIPDTAALGSPGSSLLERNKIVGNSVPIALGEAIGRSFSKSIRLLQLEVDLKTGKPNGLNKAKIQKNQYVLENLIEIERLGGGGDEGLFNDDNDDEDDNERGEKRRREREVSVELGVDNDELRGGGEEMEIDDDVGTPIIWEECGLSDNDSDEGEAEEEEEEEDEDEDDDVIFV